MALIVWSPSLSVGVNEIDTQHKKLIEIANRLNDAMSQGKGKAVLDRTFTELVAYTQYHFNAEQKLMAQIGYVESAKHKQEHADLVATVADLKAKHESGKAVITLQVMSFLREWLTKHINGSDRALGKALNAKGIQ